MPGTGSPPGGRDCTATLGPRRDPGAGRRAREPPTAEIGRVLRAERHPRLGGRAPAGAIRRQVRILGTRITFAPAKGGKERDIPLPESVALRLSAYVHLMPSSDDRMRQAVDTDFAQWETEMSDGPATAQGVRR